MILWLFIGIRIVANPFSNVFQKLLTRQGADPLFIIGAIHGLLAFSCLPIFAFGLPPLPLEFWLNMSICTFLTIGGNVLIVHALKRSDLSLLGPINAWKSVVGLVPGFVFLGETPGLMGLGGIVLIVAGSYFLADTAVKKPRQSTLVRFFGDRGVQFRFAALILSALEAVVLKKALLVSTPLAAFAVWSAFGFAVSIVAIAVLIPREKVRNDVGIFGANLPIYLLLFATTGLMQIATIIILDGFFVAYALALFQTSAILSVVLGWRMFQERHVLKRLAGSGIMVAGAALIIVGGN